MAESDAYREVERGTRELHRLIDAGMIDSPEADAVRDSMDGPWRLLSEAERERIRELAATLSRRAG